MLDTKDDLTYSYTVSQQWDNKQYIIDQLTKVSPVDSDITIQYLDIPRLHCFDDKAGDAFFDALADTEDLTLFDENSECI